MVATYQELRAPGPSAGVSDGRDSQLGGEGDLGGVSLGVLAYAVKRTGAYPQDKAPQMFWAPLDLGVEKPEGGSLGGQQFVGVVQVLRGLGDRPPGVVVEPAVLVTGHDMPGLEGPDFGES